MNIVMGTHSATASKRNANFVPLPEKPLWA